MKKQLVIFIVFIAAVFTASAQTSDAITAYINQYKDIAIQEEIRTGVPAAITLAQGIFESQAGQSDLAISSNNHFGIKCKDEWTGAKVYHDDDARNECFRSYNNVAESYADHSNFLKNRPNYASLFYLDPADYKAWAHGLKKAGYATNPQYAKRLIQLIEDNDLESFTYTALDYIKSGKQYVATVSAEGSTSTVKNAVVLPQPSGDVLEEQNTEPALAEYNGGNFPTDVFTINKTKVLYVKAGTSLFAVASNNNITFQKLLDFNDLDNADILQKDQLIYLEKKPKKSNAKPWHVVADGETIEYIAMIEGVQLQSLYEYNKMQKGLEPAPGEKVYLQSGKQPYYPKLLAKANTH